MRSADRFYTEQAHGMAHHRNLAQFAIGMAFSAAAIVAVLAWVMA